MSDDILKIKPNIVGKLSGGMDIVEVRCPVCPCDRVESIIGDIWECCECGQKFEIDYKKDS